MQQLMSISTLMKRGWDIYSANFQKFLIPIGIMLIPDILYYILQVYDRPELLLLKLLITLAMIIVNMWIAIVILTIIDKIYKNQPFDINKTLEIAFKKIPSYFLVTLLTGLIVFGGFILLIIPGIIFMVWYCFSAYITVLEEKDNKGMAALKASKNLVKGRWGATFWRLLLPGLVVYAVIIVVVIILSYVISGGIFNLESFNSMIMFNALTSLITLILMPLFVTFSVILYHNLKETQEVQTSAPVQNQ